MKERSDGFQSSHAHLDAEIMNTINLPKDFQAKLRLYLRPILIVILGGVGILIYFMIPQEERAEVGVNSLTDKEQIEIQFEEDRDNLKVVQATLGQNASRGFRYTFYRDESGVRVVREVWEGDEENTPEVRYYFFEEEKIALVRRLKGEPDSLDALIQGLDENTSVRDKLFFEDAKMVQWFDEEGNSVDLSDPRWAEIERLTILNTNYFINDFKTNYLNQ